MNVTQKKKKQLTAASGAIRSVHIQRIVFVLVAIITMTTNELKKSIKIPFEINKILTVYNE